MSDDPLTENDTMFEVSLKALHNLSTLMNLPKQPRSEASLTYIRCRLSFSHPTEGTSRPWKYAPCTLQCPAVHGIGHFGFTTLGRNISRLSDDEIFQIDVHLESGQNPMVRCNQSNIVVMEDSMRQFFKTVQLYLDPFAGCLMSSKALLKVEMHHCFVRCHKDVRCLYNPIPSLLETYGYQLTKQARDLTADENWWSQLMSTWGQQRAQS